MIESDLSIDLPVNSRKRGNSVLVVIQKQHVTSQTCIDVYLLNKKYMFWNIICRIDTETYNPVLFAFFAIYISFIGHGGILIIEIPIDILTKQW